MDALDEMMMIMMMTTLPLLPSWSKKEWIRGVPRCTHAATLVQVMVLMWGQQGILGSLGRSGRGGQLIKYMKIALVGGLLHDTNLSQ